MSLLLLFFDVGDVVVVPIPTPGEPGVIEMEFNGRGNGWTAVADVLRKTGISWRRGFPGSRVLDCVADVGVMHFDLDNSERNSAGLVGYYSPDHVNKRTGFYQNIRVRYTIGSEVRFTGVLDAIDPAPGTNQARTVSCEVVDWMDEARRVKLSDLPVQVNKRGDEVFQVLIDSLTVISHPDAVEKDPGTDIFPYTLDRTRDEQTGLWDEIYRLCLSGLDRCWVRGDGTVVYESRTRRASSSTNLDTFTDSHGFTPTRDRTGVVNRVLTTVHPRVPSPSSIVMYSLNQPMQLVPGQPIVILGPWTDPANPNVRVGAVSLDSVTPTTDYLVNSAQDGSGVDLTSLVTVQRGLSGNATEFTLSLAGVQAGYVVKLQQRGKPLYDYGPTVLKAEDDVSIQQYGLASQPIDMAYQADPNVGLEVAQYVVFSSANPVTQVSGFQRLVAISNQAEVTRSVTRSISDRIGISDPVTGINRSFFINAIEESEIDGVLRTQWLLAPADSTSFWLLEVVGRSELDATTRLGFGLIIGHTDVAHGDTHTDTAHSDSAHADTHTDTHTDNAHQDVAHQDGASHGDIAHVDSAHVDTHGDGAHSDVSHVDSHSDTSHSDSAHGDSHSDIAHSDTPHADTHFDEYRQFWDVLGGHYDQHFDAHNDSHNDSAHSDTHGDVAHNDTVFVDNHGDTSHSDVAHSDTHSDVVHSDSAHGDASSHADTAHSDVAHTDTHGDVAHTDVAHGDAAHDDTHSDTEHGDIN